MSERCMKRDPETQDACQLVASHEGRHKSNERRSLVTILEDYLICNICGAHLGTVGLHMLVRHGIDTRGMNRSERAHVYGIRQGDRLSPATVRAKARQVAVEGGNALRVRPFLEAARKTNRRKRVARAPSSAKQEATRKAVDGAVMRIPKLSFAQQLAALSLSRSGSTQRRIAQMMDVSQATVRKAIKSATRWEIEQGIHGGPNR